MICKTRVIVSRATSKQILRLPQHIKEALQYWIFTVETIGIRETRKLPGYHDEPLRGDRFHQRSVRLNKSYRIFYIERNQGIEILILEVNKHEY